MSYTRARVHDIPPGNVSTFSYFVPPTLLTRANFPSNPSPLINSSGGKGELTGGYDPFSTEIPSSIPIYTRFESRTPWNSRVTFDGNFVFTRKIRYSPIESYNVTVSIKRKDRVTWRLTAIMDRIFSPIVSSPPLFPLFFPFHSIPGWKKGPLHVFQRLDRTDSLRLLIFPSPRAEIRGFLTRDDVYPQDRESYRFYNGYPTVLRCLSTRLSRNEFTSAKFPGCCSPKVSPYAGAHCQ